MQMENISPVRIQSGHLLIQRQEDQPGRSQRDVQLYGVEEPLDIPYEGKKKSDFRKRQMIWKHFRSESIILTQMSM